MLKSDLVKILQKEIAITGDHHMKSYRIEDAGGGYSGCLYSSERKLPNGRKAKMNWKEYRDYLLKQRELKEG